MSDATVINFPVTPRPRPVEVPIVKTPESKAAFQRFADTFRRRYGTPPPAEPMSDQEEIDSIERRMDAMLARLADLNHSRVKLEFWLSVRISEHFAAKE